MSVCVVCECVCVYVCVRVCVCVRASLTLTLVSLYRMGSRLSRRSAMRTGLWAAELNATMATRFTHDEEGEDIYTLVN